MDASTRQSKTFAKNTSLWKKNLRNQSALYQIIKKTMEKKNLYASGFEFGILERILSFFGFKNFFLKKEDVKPPLSSRKKFVNRIDDSDEVCDISMMCSTSIAGVSYFCNASKMAENISFHILLYFSL
ncbi:hypothetical protein AVEN_194768-1 [Araneus ventricosus]|uniref:Uncharacterized protein n=1 Tax=Araneus ventricosus TaxID=182803 RepID=A0A4Y2B2E5_ARAVE|nr:hypothetical protein AVEN_194768-1 [Araneus ventricosus]